MIKKIEKAELLLKEIANDLLQELENKGIPSNKDSIDKLSDMTDRLSMYKEIYKELTDITSLKELIRNEVAMQIRQVAPPHPQPEWFGPAKKNWMTDVYC